MPRERDDQDDGLALAVVPVNEALVDRVAGVLRMTWDAAKDCWRAPEKTERGQWSQRTFAAAAGVNAAYVSQWMNQRKAKNRPEFAGKLNKLEAALEEALLRVDTDRVQVQRLFPTAVSRQFADFAAFVIQCGMIATFTGNSGRGKTCAVRLFAERRPLVKVITVDESAGGKDALLRAVFAAFETRQAKRTEARAEFILRRLTDVKCALIIDNAHKLSLRAFALLCDWNDKAAVPVILVGNPAMLDRMKQDAQIYSRAGLQRVAAWGPEKAQDKCLDALRDAVDGILERDWPEAAGVLRKQALAVAGTEGELRGLEKHLHVAREIVATTEVRDPVAAFRHAHEMLIHDGRAVL